MTLVSILGICATFFTILILCVHLSVLGFKWAKAKSKKQKEADLSKMRQLLEQIRQEDKKAVANAIDGGK